MTLAWVSGCGIHAHDGTRAASLHAERDAFGSQARCVPAFPNRDGWFGADGAYSVPLPPSPDTPSVARSVWLFGDSFVDPTSRSARRSYPLIHNSVGLSTCNAAGEWAFEAFWRNSEAEDGSVPDETARAFAFFAPRTDSGWVRTARESGADDAYYWPFDGFVHGGQLFVSLLRVVPAKPRGPFRLPFRLAGMDLARIENPIESPREWRFDILPLSEDASILPGSAYLVRGATVYAFAFLDVEGDRSPRVLTRLDASALFEEDPSLPDRFETLGRDGRWHPGLRPEIAEYVMRDDATEMSVHFDPDLARYVAIYTSPRPPSEREGPESVLMRLAPEIEGPWSAPRSIHTIAETRRDAGGEMDSNLFCYAGKAHPQFSSSGKLLATYVCNLFARSEASILGVLERLAESPDLYRPRAVSIALPAGTGADTRADTRRGAGDR